MRRPYHQPLGWGKRLAVKFGDQGLLFVGCPWRGMRLLAAGTLPAARCDWVYRLKSEREFKVRKPTIVDDPQGVARPHALVGPGLAKCAVLADWFTCSKYDDGISRKAGWLGLSCEGGLWKVLLKEPSLGLMIRTEVKTLDTLWASLEALLSQPVVPWENDARAAPPAPRKRGGRA